MDSHPTVDPTVVVATFAARADADLARAALESAGIPSAIAADDGGGLYPPLDPSRGVRLLVRSSDLADALAVLAPESG